jgi:colicin import membrane protein
MTHQIISSIALAMAFFASTPGYAQDAEAGTSGQTALTLADVLERYAPGRINSTEIASQALDEVGQQRAMTEAQFAKQEVVCHEKFFVTSCMDAAKDRRRAALKQLRAIEVEANAYNRRANAERRERALRERQLKQETEAADRQSMANPEKSGKESETQATPQDIADVESRSRRITATGDAAQTKPYNTERAAERAKEQSQEREKESAAAKKRADNVEAYKKKQQHSIERQREIAAEREAKKKEGGAKSQ